MVKKRVSFRRIFTFLCSVSSFLKRLTMNMDGFVCRNQLDAQLYSLSYCCEVLKGTGKNIAPGINFGAGVRRSLRRCLFCIVACCTGVVPKACDSPRVSEIVSPMGLAKLLNMHAAYDKESTGPAKVQFPASLAFAQKPKVAREPARTPQSHPCGPSAHALVAGHRVGASSRFARIRTVWKTACFRLLLDVKIL